MTLSHTNILVPAGCRVGNAQMKNNSWPLRPLVSSGLLPCLFWVLHPFEHCTGHITAASWKGRENQYIEFVAVLYCKLPTNGKQLPAFPLEAVPGIKLQPQRWEATVLPLSHRGPSGLLPSLILYSTENTMSLHEWFGLKKCLDTGVEFCSMYSVHF